MRTSSRRVWTASIAATMVVAGVLVAPAAHADPSSTPASTAQTLVGFGSSLTEKLFDRVANLVNTTAGAQKIASYGASGVSPIVVKPNGAELPRPRSESDARELLSVAYGRLATGHVEVPGNSFTVTNPEAAGQVDFARTTLPPSASGGDAPSSSGIWSYVPFAKESIALAVNPSTVVNNGVNVLPLTIGSSSDTAYTPSIYSIYHCLARWVYLSATDTYVGVGPSGTLLPSGATRAIEIKPVLPSYDLMSETRRYFVTALAGYPADSSNLVSSNPSASCIRTSTLISGTNTAITDANMGLSLATIGAGAIGPYSVSSWIAQSRSATTGVTDNRRGVVLLSMKWGFGLMPPVMSNGDAAPLFPTTRYVFNVVPYHRVADSSTREYAVFNGSNSDICKNSSFISLYGFIPLTNTAVPASTSDCGYIGYRAGYKVAPPVDLSLEFSQVAVGDNVDLTVKVNQMAGIATFHSSSPSGETKIPDSETNVGSYDFYGTKTIVFDSVSATPGDVFSYRASYQTTDTNMFSGTILSSEKSLRVAEPYSVSLTDLPDRVVSGSRVPITATVTAGAGGRLVGGTLKLVNQDGWVYASTRLPKRATSATFEWIPTGSGSRTVKAVFDPDGSSPSLSAETETQDLEVASYAPSMSVSSTAGFTDLSGVGGFFGSISTSSSTVPALAVVLSSAGGTPTGTVSVYISTSPGGGTGLTTYPVKVAADGIARVKLPLASKWRVTGTSSGVIRYLRVVYSGDSLNYSSSQSLKVLIKN